MATDLLFDDDGDLVLVGGRPVIISGLEEIAQCVRTLLTTPKGTALNDDELGIDMSFLAGGFDEEMAIEAATDAIMQDKRVIVVHKITATYDYERSTVIFNLSYTTTLGEIGQDTPSEVEVTTNALN